MKRVFCPKCDQMITLSDEKIREAIEKREGRLDVVCDACGHQLRMRLNVRRKNTSERTEAVPLAFLSVVENIFGFKQQFPLYEGITHLGRRNKDTPVDIAVLTSDPSMDRHHCIFKAEQTTDGNVRLWVADDDSRTGTFLTGRLLAKGEFALLHFGDVITLGATSIIVTPVEN
ncbi:FHA domain-containing protein [Porphyromonas macacae]|uniref:FHA domain-containing protein n=1 Tax=Porphyromonas macacae TaxID=28115 RepID=UPI00359FCBBF